MPKYKGRMVTPQTKWWMINSNLPSDRLFCVHNVALCKHCEDCKEASNNEES